MKKFEEPKEGEKIFFQKLPQTKLFDWLLLISLFLAFVLLSYFFPSLGEVKIYFFGLLIGFILFFIIAMIFQTFKGDSKERIPIENIYYFSNYLLFNVDNKKIKIAYDELENVIDGDEGNASFIFKDLMYLKSVKSELIEIKFGTFYRPYYKSLDFRIEKKYSKYKSEIINLLNISIIRNKRDAQIIELEPVWDNIDVFERLNLINNNNSQIVEDHGKINRYSKAQNEYTQNILFVIDEYNRLEDLKELHIIIPEHRRYDLNDLKNEFEYQYSRLPDSSLSKYGKSAKKLKSQVSNLFDKYFAALNNIS